MKSPYEDIPPPNDPIVILPKSDSNSSTRAWIVIICILAAASVLYRLMVYGHFEQTALMFIGLPTFLAICLSTTNKPTSATGTVCKGITMFLLLLAILAIEGVICILIAAPLFYLVGGIIGALVDYINSKGSSKKGPYCIAVGLLLAFSLEGTNDTLSFGREERISVTHQTSLSLTEARAKIAQGPEFDLEELPMFLKMGFPMPKKISGHGIQQGDQWSIHFAGGEGSPGDLVVEITESSARKITFTNIGDTSHIAHWLHWKTITWILTENEHGTQIDLHLEYRRDLDPAWYFKPVERYGVRKAGEYFIDQTFAE